MPDYEGQPTQISVGAIYGHRTRRGMVSLQLGDTQHLMPPAKAREIAGFLLEAAGSAEGDEALMQVMERAGADEGRAAQMLMAMRQARAEIDRRAREEARRSLAQDQFDPDQMN